MIGQLLRAELMKIKRKGLWLLSIIAPIGVVGLQMVNYGVRKDYLLAQSDNDWEYYLLNVCSFTGLGLILGVVILTSLMTSIENETNAWKQWIATPTTRTAIYTSKVLTIASLLLVATIILAIVTLGYGLTLGLGDQIPYIDILKYSFYPYLSTLALLSLHMWLSTVNTNQGFPLTIGILGTIIAMISNNLPDWVIWKWPTLSNEWDNPLINVGLSITTAFILYILGLVHFTRKDVA